MQKSVSIIIYLKDDFRIGLNEHLQKFDIPSETLKVCHALARVLAAIHHINLVYILLYLLHVDHSFVPHNLSGIETRLGLHF